MATDKTFDFSDLDSSVAEALDSSYVERSEIQITLTGIACRALHAIAFADGTTSEELAAMVIDLWARNQFAKSNALVHALANPVIPNAETERTVELDFARQLRDAGIACKSQVKCGVGIADLVVGDYVLELKYRIETWRELHQACGQAKAYAAEMGLPHCIVTAKHINKKLMTKPVAGVEVLEIDAAIKHLIQIGH